MLVYLRVISRTSKETEARCRRELPVRSGRRGSCVFPWGSMMENDGEESRVHHSRRKQDVQYVVPQFLSVQWVGL